MSILDTIAGKSAKPAYERPTAPAIAQKLEQARVAVEAAERHHAGLAFEFARGEIDQGVVNQAAKELAAARDLVATLEAAHRVAIRRDDESLNSQRQALRTTQFRAVQKHLAARDAAAAALSAALADAAKHYRELVERSEKAIAATPIGATWPGSENEYRRGALHRLVATELFRVSGDVHGNNTLPGAHIDPMRRNNPGAVEPLAETIRKASAQAIAKLSAFVKGAE